MTNLLSYDFFQNGLIVGVLIGIILPVIGTIILLRRMTFIADSIGHINMAGIALSIFLSSFIPILANFTWLITIIWTICAGMLIEFLREKYKDYKELSITIVYSLSIAMMMIFLNSSSGYNSSLFSLLFGNINAITNQEVIYIGISTCIILAICGKLYKQFLLLALEEDYSKLYGVNVKFTKYLVMVIIAISITIAIKAIGVLLVSSLIVIPLLAASNWGNNLRQALIIGIGITEFSIISGLFLSFYLNVPTSAIIVICVVIIYGISIIAKTRA